MAGGKEPWKELERRTAKNLDGTRLWRPDFSDTQPDGESDTHVWDCKAYQQHASVTMYVEAEKKYRKFTSGRRFLLVLFSRKQNQQGDFVLLRMRDYMTLLQKAGELDGGPSSIPVLSSDPE